MPKVTVRMVDNFKTDITARTHNIKSDEPVDKGGDDTGPTPYELLLSSIAACSAITMRIYSRRKGWPLESVEIEVEHERVHADDCVECEKKEGHAYIDVIRKRFVLHGDLSPEQRARIAEIGGRCPVQKTVAHGVHFIEEVAVD
jgi:putative redox protein